MKPSKKSGNEKMLTKFRLLLYLTSLVLVIVFMAYVIIDGLLSPTFDFIRTFVFGVFFGIIWCGEAKLWKDHVFHELDSLAAKAEVKGE